jgi:hypothetical protein
MLGRAVWWKLIDVSEVFNAAIYKNAGNKHL